MRKQVEFAVAKDWEKVKIDKQRQIEEHQERKDNFYSSLALLEQDPVEKTDWSEIKQLLKRMATK